MYGSRVRRVNIILSTFPSLKLSSRLFNVSIAYQEVGQKLVHTSTMTNYQDNVLLCLIKKSYLNQYFEESTK